MKERLQNRPDYQCPVISKIESSAHRNDKRQHTDGDAETHIAPELKIAFEINDADIGQAEKNETTGQYYDDQCQFRLVI